MGQKTEQKATHAIAQTEGGSMAVRAERRATPRGDSEERAAALCENVLAVLASGARSTKQVTAIVGGDAQPVYRALLSLQKAGKVRSVREHRPTALGALGCVWTRTDVPKFIAPPPPQDPLLWALFRAPDQAGS
jgi:hypothetical protein